MIVFLRELVDSRPILFSLSLSLSFFFSRVHTEVFDSPSTLLFPLNSYHDILALTLFKLPLLLLLLHDIE